MTDLARRVRRNNELHYGKLLKSGVGLFEPGVPEDANDPLDFVLRVNRKVFARGIMRAESKIPDPAKAITAGRLGRHAELVVFGTWMVCDEMAGAKTRSGPAPDVRRLLKVAACGFAALLDLDRGSKDTGQNRKRVSTKDIARFWKTCFGSAEATSAYTANLRSLRKNLSDYLACLAAGDITFKGQTVTESPQMARLAKAIQEPKPVRAARSRQAITQPAGTAGAQLPALPAGTTARAVNTASTVVLPKTFEIPLVYSSPAEEARYRGTVPKPHTTPNLKYAIEPLKATSKTHGLRADLVDRLVLRPAHDLGRMVQVKALIDRVALTFSTMQVTSYQVLQSAMSNAGANVYVADRTIVAKQDRLFAWLPEVELTQPTGKHFAAIVQEPTPSIIRSMLHTIENVAGIDGEVRLFLIELAVDFYPRKALMPSDALLAREQIVGLVQRHLWSAGHEFDVPRNSVRRYIDPRQVYQEGDVKKTRRLFAAKRGDIDSDCDLELDSVRRRLLRTDRGNDLFLDATIYRGNSVGKKRINIQHKTRDHQNPVKKSWKKLRDEERRARIEVSLTSLETLEQAGLKTIEDLKRCNFRTLKQDLLVLRLPTCINDAEDVKRTIAHLETRGVYGVEMSQRARRFEERKQAKRKPRKTARDAKGQLVAWSEMNDMVGAALDRLTKEWNKP